MARLPLAFVTPTLDRAKYHPQLHATFSAQRYEPKKLYVYDESAEPSSYFSALADPRVVYVHAPGKPRVGGVTRIGAARNALNALVAEPLIAHLDDDDELDPSYAEVMVARLGRAALAKLDVWRCLHEATRLIFEWDTRAAGGRHWAILGDQIRAVDVAPGEMPPELVATIPDWYGFSLVYPRSTWEAHPFPEEGTEDIPFVRAVKDAGLPVVYVHDAAHLVLHAIGSSLSQHAYPQRLLGAGADRDLRSAVAEGMMGRMSAMVELPEGKALTLTPGRKVAVLAALDKAFTLRSIGKRAEFWGVKVEAARDDVAPSEFGVSAPEEGLRLVLVTGTAAKDVPPMPWKLPGFLGVHNKSHVVKAWMEGAAAATGAGADNTMNGLNAQGQPERYQPGRYAPGTEPHKCTAKSAAGIAAQLDPRWVYVGGVKDVVGWREHARDVTTPMGSKHIPAWTRGGELVLQCPYTGEYFRFRRDGGPIVAQGTARHLVMGAGAGGNINFKPPPQQGGGGGGGGGGNVGGTSSGGSSGGGGGDTGAVSRPVWGYVAGGAAILVFGAIVGVVMAKTDLL